MPTLSLIIPALDEAASLASLLGDIGRLRIGPEVLVVDGGSADATRSIARDSGARLIRTDANRGLQLQAGAAAARGAMLCFLHADVRLNAGALATLNRLGETCPRGAFAFRLRIDGDRWAYRIVEAGANVRSRLIGLPFGDQGLVVHRTIYERAGGYPEHPLMEDVALARSLRRISPIRLLPSSIQVSARRWERDGVVRRTLGNQLLLARYLLGVKPGTLARSYRSEGSPDA